MDLLLKTGYGYDKNAGVVAGRSHEGGVDGIISEDKLGLDLIYIQAKRYSGSNTVGSKEVQAFVGAMENVQKGVFITTSKYTKEAVLFIERQSKSIKLIDGKLLADLLVKYQVGINVVQTLSLYKIDSDYYGE
jgi:restriction system protein